MGRTCAARPRLLVALLPALVLAGCDQGGGSGMLPECGNGTIEGVEQCDDGNTVSCDGCSAICETETGWICGDGILNQDCGEECDDGNTVPGDGCDGSCQSETCGDGVQDPDEECDDGNTVSCDGCSAICEAETGWICGDGVLNPDCGEQCDDGDTVSCDGCSAICETETGWVCGDGILNPACGEECDDGNTVPGDGCDADCRLEDPPLAISGDYDVDIDGSDDCGFGTGPTGSPMRVTEVDQTRASVDIPIGGAGGECNPQSFDRQGNTLLFSETSFEQIGSCTVRIEVTADLTFFQGGGVTGSETTRLAAAAGDCSGLGLPCRVDLTLTGMQCSGCFSCVPPPRSPAGPAVGVLGGGAGIRLDDLGGRAGFD